MTEQEQQQQQNPDAEVEAVQAGQVVYFDAAGPGHEPVPHVGLVIATYEDEAGQQHARVKSLGAAEDSADFLAGSLRGA